MAESAPGLDALRKQVADAQAAQDKSAEAVALMMLSQGFYEADRLAEARQTYLQACEVTKTGTYPHQIRLAQAEALMARGLELQDTRPTSPSAYRAFFSAGIVLEDLGDDGRTARENAYAHARWIEEERIRPGRPRIGQSGSEPAVASAPRAKMVRREKKTAPSSTTGARKKDVLSVDPAVRDALARRERRAEARRILETDPALARELGIGRPDLPHRYDDGGVLDVNHVPAELLATLPGFTPELARRVVEVRAELGRFTFITELVVYADVPQEIAEELSDRLVFLT